MVVYTEERLSALKKRRTAFVVSVIAAAVVCAVVCGALCLFMREYGAVITVINVIVTVLVGWYALGCIFAVVVPLGCRMSHVGEMLNGERGSVSGTVAECGATVTVKRHIRAVQIKTADGKIIYWDEAAGACPFNVGDTVRFSVCRGFICEYEAVEDVGQ